MLAALCLAIVFAIALSSYMTLCFTSLSMSTRNVVNAHCSELAEAGVEQALYSINNGVWSGWNVAVSGSQSTMTTAMTMTESSGLVPTASSPTPLNFGNGAIGTVNITVIENLGVMSTIQSQGQMTLPNASTLTTITRTLTASSAPYLLGNATAPVFVNAVGATTMQVIFNAGGTLDSYSSVTSLGAPQAYSSMIAGASAVVLSQDLNSVGSTVRLNNAVVNGYAVGYDQFSPSTSNWLSYGGSGMLVGPTTQTGVYIDSSRILTTPVPYQPLSPENPPNWTQSLPLAGAPSGNILTNSCTLGSTTAPYPVYNASGINLAGGVVVITGKAVIELTGGSISMSGNAEIRLTPGASLAIYADYGSVNISCTGTGGITNTSPIPLAKNFALLSTNNTNISNTVQITQATPFFGVVYFPYLRVSVGNTGVSAPVTGSLVGESVTFTGSPILHYDVALRHPDSLQADVAFTSVASPVLIDSMVASVP
jgi:hypothetical protein